LNSLLNLDNIPYTFNENYTALSVIINIKG